LTELAIDTETTTWNKGNPYDSRNSLVCFSICDGDCGLAFKWPDARSVLDDKLAVSNLIVGFNFKFDWHWLAKENVVINKSVWDVQIAEFIISHQKNVLPSLNETCIKYGIPTKKDVVATEYWAKGINTHEIPWEILQEYAAHDAYITLQCYYAQQECMTPRQKLLCKMQCMDMGVLREMEANGILYDEDLCIARSKEVDDQISEIKQKLSKFYPNVPINFASNDHLSAFLYGGVVKETVKEHIGFYKSGLKAGEPKFRNKEVDHILPRLYEPLKGTELLKEGMFATDEGTLKKLKGKKDVVELLLTLSKLEKKNGTYYKGLVKLREDMHWPKNILHGQFNQTIAATGRLSCSKPNLQNFDSSLQDIFISAFDE
jgi:DNA polymerase-1